MQLLIIDNCPLITSREKQHKNHKPWDIECTRLKYLYLQALDKEQCSDRAEFKVETAGRKKAHDQKLKKHQRERTTAHIEIAENKLKVLW